MSYQAQGDPLQAHRSGDTSAKPQLLSTANFLPPPLPHDKPLKTQHGTKGHVRVEIHWRRTTTSRRKGFRLTLFPRRWRREEWMREGGEGPAFILLLHRPRRTVTARRQQFSNRLTSKAKYPASWHRLCFGFRQCCPFLSSFLTFLVCHAGSFHVPG